ncbi:MAG TPA: hypothetical protein VF103_08700 [Polyangiaceae bacterium]
MAVLLACPFCRTLYRRGEGTTCAVCGVKLVPFERLPPAAEEHGEADELDEGEAPVLPEDERLRWNDFGRGRGALLVLSVLGFCLFFAPWVAIAMPEDVVRSGFDLARGRAGWLWGGATGWLVLAPLAWSRRTIRKMLGARAISAMLAAMTLFEVCMLVALPPRGGRLPVELHWAWGLYASAVVSLVATVIAMRFGGTLPPLSSEPEASESSPKRILH